MQTGGSRTLAAYRLAMTGLNSCCGTIRSAGDKRLPVQLLRRDRHVRQRDQHPHGALRVFGVMVGGRERGDGDDPVPLLCHLVEPFFRLDLIRADLQTVMWQTFVDARHDVSPQRPGARTTASKEGDDAFCLLFRKYARIPALSRIPAGNPAFLSGKPTLLPEPATY